MKGSKRDCVRGREVRLGVGQRPDDASSARLLDHTRGQVGEWCGSQVCPMT